jgi:hypothetical protein
VGAQPTSFVHRDVRFPTSGVIALCKAVPHAFPQGWRRSDSLEKPEMKAIKTSLFVAAALLVGVPSFDAAGEERSWRTGPFPLECAERDLQVMTQIEQYGEGRDMRPELADEAFWTMMRARVLCYDARVGEGLALYDSIQTRTLAQHQQ